MPTKEIPIEQISFDGTQTRAKINEATVSEYAEQIAEGAEFPPVVVYYDGTTYHLADGFHRTLAHQRAGLGTVMADVRKGSQRDALLHSLGANHDHGLPRTAEDKRNAVRICLNDPEWSSRSDRWIAERCRVSPTTVGRVRNELESLNCPQWTVDTNVAISKKVSGQNSGKVATPDEHDTIPITREVQSRDGKTRHVPLTPPAQVDQFKDQINRPVPERMMLAYEMGRTYRAVIQDLGGIRQRVAKTLDHPGSEYLRDDMFQAGVANLQNVLRSAAYYTECPDCIGQEVTTACRLCQGAGFITKQQYHALSDIQKEKLQ